jgi:hypothetical protein
MPLFINSTDHHCLVLKCDWALETEEIVKRIGFFTPWFGHYRKCVNPGKPKVSGRTISFRKAGEYYLRINEAQPVKVLVLPPGENISRSVLRIFDFYIANKSAMNRDETQYAADPSGVIARWFRNDEPMLLLCSSAHDFFGRIIKEVFALPTRRVLLPGTGRLGSEVYKVIHHALEVYLPDIGKWALFDVSNRFVVRWFDAFDIVDFVRNNEEDTPLGTGYVKESALASLDIYNGGIVSFLPKEHDCIPADGDWSACLSKLPVAYSWINLFKLYHGGVAYFGADSHICEVEENNPWGKCIFASRHEDHELRDAAVEWMRENGFTPLVLPQEELKVWLAEAFGAEIAEARWSALSDDIESMSNGQSHSPANQGIV